MSIWDKFYLTITWWLEHSGSTVQLVVFGALFLIAFERMIAIFQTMDKDKTAGTFLCVLAIGFLTMVGMVVWEFGHWRENEAYVQRYLQTYQDNHEPEVAVIYQPVHRCYVAFHNNPNITDVQDFATFMKNCKSLTGGKQ